MQSYFTFSTSNNIYISTVMVSVVSRQNFKLRFRVQYVLYILIVITYH